MADDLQDYPIRQFGAVGTLQDSTQLGQKLTKARNTIMRPLGAMKPAPKYQRLWAIGNSATIYTTLAGLTYTPFGGSSRAINPNTDDTIAVRIAKDGKNFLLLYSFPARKCRGFFYMGDDGTFTGTPDFTAGNAEFEVVAVNLDPTARWYGNRYYGALYLGNGVNDNAVAQLGRTTNPGVWRKAASNARPAAPVIRQVERANATNVQATLVIPGAGAAFTRVPLVTCSSDDSTDLIYANAHGLADGRAISFPTSSYLPAAITADQTYYVRDSSTNSFKIALTSGGSAVNITGANTSKKFTFRPIDRLYSVAHPFSNGQTVRLDTTSALPDGLALNTTYYIVNATVSQFGLATSSGSAALLATSDGAGVNRAASTASGKRNGSASLTFTADPTNFPGTSGHNIFVSITFNSASYDVVMGSHMTGSGTVSDPYHYAITTVLGASSNDAIVAFVADDTNAIGILSASTSVADGTEDTGS